MNSSKLILSLLVVFVLSSCSKDRELLKQYTGKFKTTKYESNWTNVNGCNGYNDFTSFSVNNPGKIVFTGKKVIDGPAKASERPYLGYFDYDFETTNHNGEKVSLTEKKYFVYDALQEDAFDENILLAQIYVDSYEYKMRIVKDGKKTISISYTYKTGCYSVEEIHYVED